MADNTVPVQLNAVQVQTWFQMQMNMWTNKQLNNDSKDMYFCKTI